MQVLHNMLTINYLWTYMRVLQWILKKKTIMKPIWRYCNGCKRISNYYDTYMRELHI